MLLDRLRQVFTDHGHIVNHRDEVDAAAAGWYLEYAVSTLAKLRCKTSRIKGPPYVDYRFGVRYPIVGLARYQEQRLRNRGA